MRGTAPGPPSGGEQASVIASVAKQSSVRTSPVWIASGYALAMTTCRGGPWACREGNSPRPPFGGRASLPSLRA
ncbi:MAG: hypothetical protein LBT00_13450 [Spirochaetaceae bacterium]|nr:hypothetical protein [Spirochaetaceae bacterium]